MVEIKRNVSVFDQSPAKDSAEYIDPETIKYSLKKLKTSNDLMSFAEGEIILEGSSRDLSSILERRQWGNIFTQLKPGDKVLTFLTPGANFLAIKYLNDEIFGQEITNRIIKKRRDLVKQAVEVLNHDKTDNEKISSLESDYKTEVLRIPEGVVVDTAQIDEVLRAIDHEMKDFILELAEKNDNGRDKSKLEDFKQAMLGRTGKKNSKGGFKMNYGLAVVQEGKDDKEKAEKTVLALAHSLQAGRMARAESGYGLEYDESAVLKDIEEIKSLRNEIVYDGNTITDVGENEFTIFHKDEKLGIFKLNKDLLRAVRKSQFEVDPKKDKEVDLLKKIILYTKKLNILDTLKPFVAEEVVSVASQAVTNRFLGEKMSENQRLEIEEKEQVAKTLFADERAPQFTSKMEFDRRAVAMKDCAYISMDVLDLGVDQLLEYEVSLQLVDKAKDSDEKLKLFNKASLSAGDQTTAKLKEFWKKIEAVCGDDSFGLRGADNLITAHIGGDEVVLAVELGEGSGKISSNKIKNLLFRLQAISDTRVIETRIAKTEKHVGVSDEEGMLVAHLKAVKRAESGAVILKKVEEDARRLTLFLNKSSKKKAVAVKEAISGLQGIFFIEKIENNMVVKPSVVVVEKDAKFLIITKEGEAELDYESLKPMLDRVFRTV